ncbi:MAG TPA: methylmalonyl Co-A mutase-associated GTPase MeaB [Dehalococcoidales bacterium]|nr:methylmalonyl Co-A mutase-associated GTPase MeaB [Dehalococcoidales bacterium]
MGLAAEILKGDTRAAARLISLMADDAPGAAEELAELYSHSGKAYVLGVTGAPGVGKSTLTDCLIGYFRKQNYTIGVIAIDPTSMLTGGALLGDRVRMQRHAADKNVFIRSLATRGWTGGLAKAALGSVRVMDALGKDLVIIETVGSGQVEIDIVKAADTTLLVLAPGAGDEIQAMKAGIIESADVIAINKADKEGAERLKNDLETMLDRKPRGDWLPPIVLTQAVNDKGIDALGEVIIKHRDFLQNTGELSKRRRERARLELMEAIESDIKDLIQSMDGEQALEKLVDALQNGKTNPRSAAGEILKRIVKKEEH